MITYNDLYDVLRRERYSKQLQPLPKNFLKELSLYLKEKKEMIENEKENFTDSFLKIKKQYENSLSIIKEIMLRRKKKLLELAFIATETGISKRDFDNMLPIEKEYFNEIIRSIERATKKINEIIEGVSEEKKEKKNKMIVFIEDTEEFLDLDGNKLGPFKKGEIANLPEEIANILIQDRKAEMIEEE